MAHYAKVKDGIVIDIIVAEKEFFDTFIDNTPGEWVKTSYNMRGGVYHIDGEPAKDQSVINGDEARERKNFAGIGFNYDGTGFYQRKPYDSWTLNKTSYTWEAPLTYPDDGKTYRWNEDNYQADNKTGWVEDNG